ncbi:MAG: transposon-transfer assisting family protein, partial [Hominisplanchenecus sp.]
MNDFTFEERNLICIYNTGSRRGVITALEDMRRYLEEDETELMGLTDSAIEKLKLMTDDAFEK